MDKCDEIFRLVVYSTCIYLICISNYKINIIGVILLIAHIYKDIVIFEKWYLWTEYLALIMGLILMYEGYNISNNIVCIVGIIIFIGHSRQLIYDDDRYYY